MIKKGRINKYDAILLLIVMYSFTTLTQSLYSFSLNRILIMCLAFFLVAEKTMKKGKVILLLYIAMVFIVSTIQTNNFQTNIVDLIYFAVAIIQLYFFSSQKTWEAMMNSYNKFDKFINFIVFLDFSVILLAFFLPSCYGHNWGGDSYLYGFTSSAHAMGSSCCLALSLMVLVLTRRRFSIVHLGLVAFVALAVLRTGARVYLVPIVILLYYFLQIQVKDKRIRWFMYLLAGVSFIYVFLRSGMMQKFTFAINDPLQISSNLAQSFTSGRSLFWTVDLKDYLYSNLFQQLFGHGFSYIYQLNLKMVGMEIWAHNDFLNILIAGGAVGLAVYVSVLRMALKEVYRWNSRINCLILGIYVLFPAFFNGFYNYYHYASSFFIFGLVTMLETREKEKLDGKQIKRGDNNL